MFLASCLYTKQIKKKLSKIRKKNWHIPLNYPSKKRFYTFYAIFFINYYTDYYAV